MTEETWMELTRLMAHKLGLSEDASMLNGASRDHFQEQVPPTCSPGLANPIPMQTMGYRPSNPPPSKQSKNKKHHLDKVEPHGPKNSNGNDPLTSLEADGIEFVCDDKSMVALGDSRSVLRSIPDGCVDLIFADPPYGIGKNFGAMRDVFPSGEAYMEWAKEWLDECARVLRPGGTMYLMSSTQHMPLLDAYVSSRWHVINRIVWVYDSSGVQPKNRFGSLFEPILMFCRNEKEGWKFNSDPIMVEAKTGAKRKLVDYRSEPPRPYSSRKVPGNVWEFNRVRYKMAEYENHPTQKPESLLQRIILASSDPEDLVLDPFSGSFTTCKVARDLGRKSIGIDLEPNYYKIGLRRCSLATHLDGEELRRDLSRKTSNRSKNNR